LPFFQQFPYRHTYKTILEQRNKPMERIEKTVFISYRRTNVP